MSAIVAGRSGRQRNDPADPLGRCRRADAAAGDEEETHRRAEADCSSRWIKKGAEYQPHWSLIAAGAAGRAEGEERRGGSAIRSITSSRRGWKRPG